MKEKVEKIKKKFSDAKTSEGRYELLMQMGRNLPAFPQDWKRPEAQVRGCQSVLYIHALFQDGKLFFSAASDALISAGLAALVVELYSGETPEEILAHSPTFLEELGLFASLSPSRANGLSALLFRIKQEALRCLTLR